MKVDSHVVGLICTVLTSTDWKPMARKTNYGFERREREKARAAKKAERQRLKQEKSDDRKDSGATSQPVDGDIADPFSKATDKDAPSSG